MIDKVCSRTRHAFTTLCRDRQAAILPIFALMVTFLVVVAGAAIDVSRAVNAREKLAYAIDSAALSVAVDLSTSVLSNSQIKTKIEDSFRANLADAEFVDKAIENLSFVVDSDEGTVTVSSSASLNNYFIDIGGYGIEAFGPEAFSFGTNAQVAYSRFDVELAMIVDVTGSMWRDMDALRSAAESVVNILLPDSDENSASKIRISIVPYSQGVNLGAKATVVTNGNSGWKNCVTERPGPQKLTDAVYNYNGQNSEFFKTSGVLLFRNGSKISPWGDECPDEEILPLTDNKDALLNKISRLNDGGGTAGQTGVAWGWYTLSPNWSSLWPIESRPAAYGLGNSDDEVKKYAIVMTDGNFNNYFDDVEYTTVENVCEWVRIPRRWGGSRWERVCVDQTTTELLWTEYYDDNPSIADPSASRGISFCESMSEKNIEVYAVYFETTGSSFGEELMRRCASENENFYFASSSSDLIQAFSNIAKKIQQIYLSK